MLRIIFTKLQTLNSKILVTASPHQALCGETIVVFGLKRNEAVMTSQTLGLIGGIVGGIIGCLGGAYGTYCSIKAAKNDASRSFIKKASLVNWILALVFVAAIVFIPRPWNFLVWVPYSLVMIFDIRYMNRRIFELEKKG